MHMGFWFFGGCWAWSGLQADYLLYSFHMSGGFWSAAWQSIVNASTCEKSLECHINTDGFDQVPGHCWSRIHPLVDIGLEREKHQRPWKRLAIPFPGFILFQASLASLGSDVWAWYCVHHRFLGTKTSDISLVNSSLLDRVIGHFEYIYVTPSMVLSIENWSIWCQVYG